MEVLRVWVPSVVFCLRNLLKWISMKTSVSRENNTYPVQHAIPILHWKSHKIEVTALHTLLFLFYFIELGIHGELFIWRARLLWKSQPNKKQEAFLKTWSCKYSLLRKPTAALSDTQVKVHILRLWCKQEAIFSSACDEQNLLLSQEAPCLSLNMFLLPRFLTSWFLLVSLSLLHPLIQDWNAREFINCDTDCLPRIFLFVEFCS